MNTKSTCNVDECDRPTKSRGWCQTHYARWWRYGDPKVGPFATGRKRQERRLNNQGYVLVYQNDTLVLEHRKVMEEILSRPLTPGEEVHHKNGTRNDNRPENLELWLRGKQPRGRRALDQIEWAEEILRAYKGLERILRETAN